MEKIPPCKVSFKSWNETVTIKRDNSDITCSVFMEMIEKLLYASGFSKDSIDEYIIDWGNELKNKYNE